MARVTKPLWPWNPPDDQPNFCVKHIEWCLYTPAQIKEQYQWLTHNLGHPKSELVLVPCSLGYGSHWERPDYRNNECGWCEREAVWTVEFEECGHVSPCCDDHFGEYFMGIGWENYYERPEDFDPTCPDCAG